MIRADAFTLPLRDNSVDMIITSPPFFYGFLPKPSKSGIFGLEGRADLYRIKMARAVGEMKRVCKGSIWVHTSRPDLVWDAEVMMLEPWYYPESDIYTFWVGWRTEWTSFRGWKEEPAYKDGHWGVFPDELVWELIKNYGGWNAHAKILDPFAGTGVVGRVANEGGYTGINMDINGGIDAA